MRLHAFLPCSLVNGPGRRSVVWFQGCELHCAGCWNPETHSQNSGIEISVSIIAIASAILDAHERECTEGVTLSGGEPLHQATAALQLLRILHRHEPDLSFGLFTGYTERELEQGHFITYAPATLESRQRLWRNLRDLLDFAVFGRYNRGLPCSDPMRSSRNQNLGLLSARYTIDQFEEQLVEVTIASSGLVQVTGFPVLGPIH